MMQFGKKPALFLRGKIKAEKLFTSTSTAFVNDSFLTGTSGIYIEKMHELWKKDPKSVHISWDMYFSSLEKGVELNNAFQSPPTIDKGN